MSREGYIYCVTLTNEWTDSGGTEQLWVVSPTRDAQHAAYLAESFLGDRDGYQSSWEVESLTFEHEAVVDYS